MSTERTPEPVPDNGDGTIRDDGTGSEGSSAADDSGSGDVASESGTNGFTCDLCGAPMLDRHCRLVCPQCGYQRDCSDP